MALADDLKPTLSSIRAIPGQLGLRPHTVAIVAVRTSGGLTGYTGDGGRWELSYPLVEAGGYAPKVRWLKDDEKAVGSLPDGSVEIGPITPAFTGGGTSLAKLTGAELEDGAVLAIRITGPQHPQGAEYRILSTTLDRAMHYTIRAAPVGTQR